LYIAIFVLQNVEDGLFVEQVETSSSVYLEIADRNGEIFFSELVEFVDDK
jgi:hypothetical protein